MTYNMRIQIAGNLKRSDLRQLCDVMRLEMPENDLIVDDQNCDINAYVDPYDLWTSLENDGESVFDKRNANPVEW